MSALYIVLPLALLVAVGFLLVFIRSVRSGQFDDLETPGVRILHEDDPAKRRDAATTDETGPEEET